MPLLPEGKWREFVRLTTDLDQTQRPQDMAAVLELAAKIKAPSNIRAAVVTGVNPPPIESVKPLPGLAKIDTVLFKAMCEVSLQTGIDWINRSQLTDTRNELGISEEDLSDSIDILADKYFIHGTPVMGVGLDFFQITPYGFAQYASAFMPGFAVLLGQVLLSFTDNNLGDNRAIAEHLKQPLILVDYALDILASRHLITTTKVMGGGVLIGEATAQGRRAAKELKMP